MEENLKVDKKYKDAFNLGYEVAKELDLKTPLFVKEGNDITLESPMQVGMIRYVSEKQQVFGKEENMEMKSSKGSVLKIPTKKGKNKNRGKGLTP